MLALAVAQAPAASASPGPAFHAASRGDVASASFERSSSGPIDWLVLAPHPDDAVLVAAGVIARAVRSKQEVAVAFMTNGDLGCGRDGALREQEAIRGLGELGLDEQHVYFLGYPDGYLARLGEAVLPPVERRIAGACVTGNTTYAVRGHEGRDVHSLWSGRSGSYTADDAVADLSVLLDRLDPRQVVVTHPMDIHPDHAATYALLRRALARTGKTPVLHRAFVHAGDCWPIGTEPGEPCSPTVIEPDVPFPPLLGDLRDYHFTERIPVPPDFTLPDPRANPKIRSIAAHRSQLGPEPLETYLFGFSRRDEAFFVESPYGADRERPAPSGEEAAPTYVALSRTAPQQEIAQALPLAVAFEWPKGPPAVEMLAGDGGAYRLAFDGAENAAVLERIEGGRRRSLKRWLLPHDMWRARDSERVELRFEPRPADGDVSEISLYVRSEIVGVAVDVHPRRAGQRLAADFQAAQVGDLEVTLSAP